MLPSRSGRLVVSLCFMLPLGAHAGLYKCTVEGRTSYQDKPCRPDVVIRGTSRTINASGIDITPPPPPPPPQRRAKPDEPVRESVARARVEPMARRAFVSVMGSNMSAYRQMMCPQARESLKDPILRDRLREMGRRLRADKAMLDGEPEIESARLSYPMTVLPAVQMRAPAIQRILEVRFDWADGEPCLLDIQSLTRSK